MPSSQDDSLKDEFISKLIKQPVSMDKAFGQPLDELRHARERVAEISGELPATTLTDDERKQLAGAIDSRMQGVLERLADGLDLHPELAKVVPPALVRESARLSRAAGRFVTASEMLVMGGENGVLLTGAALHGLWQRTALLARETIDSPTTKATDRADMTIGMSEAFREQDMAKARSDRDSSRIQGATAKIEQQASAAEDEAATTRLITAFVRALKDRVEWAGSASPAGMRPHLGLVPWRSHSLGEHAVTLQAMQPR